MVKRFLITTAIEETWPKDSDIPVLFLGEWCRIYSRRERWSIMNAEVLSYHWDDRQKLDNDYQYLSDIYEITLQALQKQDTLENKFISVFETASHSHSPKIGVLEKPLDELETIFHELSTKAKIQW